ncbi:cyclic nucleotide-binding domain-containing protein 1 [Tiliqua scincoides]|uniref:cyclic nucleotide-binding domain-containing protein 1 n=1 Tax=Tiliqua scincoides TaxID=71010 RepID=UPI0034637054
MGRLPSFRSSVVSWTAEPWYGSKKENYDQLDEFLKISGLQTKVDYDKLDKLLKISDLQSRENPCTTEKAHQKFLALYPEIFIKEKTLLPGIPQKRTNGVHSCVDSHDDELDKDSHNIRIYLDKIEKQEALRPGSPRYIEKLQSLLPILKKIPIQRTPEEHATVYKAMKIIPEIRDQLSNAELRELSTTVVKEQWEKESKVDGSEGFFIILKGSAKPQNLFYKKMIRSSFVVFPDRRSTCTPSHSIIQVSLGVGNCFGTLEPIKRRLKTDMLTIVTEDNCEFLKIPCTDYIRVREEIAKREKLAKEELIRGSPYYQNWPMVFIFQLTAQLKWVKFPTDHVFIRVGEINNYVGFIKSGCCNAYQIIPALVKRPLGKMVKQLRQVLIGQLRPKESFGELNILLQIPSTYTLKAATPVELGIIEAEDILDLDLVTQKLLLQSVKPSFENVTYEDLKLAYIKKETEKEWKQKKDTTLNDALFYNGITPGVGRWTHEHIYSNKKRHQESSCDAPQRTRVQKAMEALAKDDS